MRRKLGGYVDGFGLGMSGLTSYGHGEVISQN
jgi:hypothetical protein